MKPRKPNTSRKLLVLGITGLGIGLSGCSQDMSDLERYIDEINERPGGPIEPIPQIEPYEGFTYSVAGERSPFEPDPRLTPDEVSGDGDGPRPDMDRRREYLERFPLDGLKLQGSLEMAGRLYAIIRDPEGTVHRVTIGNHMGGNHGEITGISESRVTLMELVPDGTGGWNQRERHISLGED